MPKWVADEKAKKKKEEEKKTGASAKPQSSSVKNVNKKASKSTFLGGAGNVNQKPKTVKKPSTKAKQVVSTTNTTAAQRQKMGMPTQQDLQNAKQSRQQLRTRTSQAIKEATSEENKGFMQRQKSGTQTEADKRRTERMTQRRTEVAKNTGAVAKKAVMDTVSGYGQSLADVDEMAKSNRNWTTAKAQKMGIDLNDRARVSKVEQERQQSIKEAREFRQELFNKQEQRQAEWDERTKNAKGLEKAWYGAVESGTGMLADTAIGAVTGTGQFGALASMGLRTYGPSANQARKEGATDKEARLYGLAQSGKEMATELMFQGAGLAKAAYGKTGLSLADKSANILTKGLTGIKADAVGAGVRALGGTAEENVEELAGWMADPLIKELTYGKAVRNRMKENLRANIPQIGSDADAANVASYFSTPQFTDELTSEYTKSGMSKEKASELAAEMRDYYVAYYSGDNERLDALEEDLAAKLSGQDKLSLKSWSMDELKDTFASTTLLTLATGMPGAVTTSVKGNQIFDSDEVKAVFGNDAVRKVADAVKNTSNKEMSLKAETMKDRLDSGKDLTGTQKYDLYQGYLEKVNETAKKARASYGVVENAREEQDLVPTMGVDRAGNTVYAKETQREYDEKYASTAVTAESLRRFMESDNSISDDEIRRTDAAIKAVSDLHVGGLTIGDAHEFAYGNTLARETLKAEEGIDLDRYIVRDANGNVDLAATNEATENALFKINADNAIKAAQAETEVYIDDTRGNIDKDLLTRFGNSGQAAWKEVNKDLDPRDLKNYLTTANAASYFYSAGRNTDMSVDEAINRYADTFKTVDNSVLEKAFAAGAEDRIIANTPGYGQTVEAGSNIQLKKTEPVITGQLIMDDDVVLPDSDQSAYLALAMSTNTNIHIVSDLNAMGKDGKPIINQATGLPVQLNGMSHGNDIYLNMNEASEKNLGYVFMHEMTHQIKQYAPNEYLALENLVRDKWFNKDATGMQAAIKQRMDLYSVKGGQQLTEEEAVEEIIADAMAEAMDDPDFAAEVCEQDINLGQQILDSIRAALRSIRQMFANTEFKNDRFHNSLLSYLGILDQAEKMWLNALATAKQNKANGLIADWQDKANKQNAPRLSVTEVSDEAHESRYSIAPQQDADYMQAVEALPSEDEDYFGRMKGLREIQKMVDEKAIENGYNIKAYHGTDSEPFNVFDRDKLRHGRQYGDGFYFSPYEEYADTYGNETREYYLKANGMTLDELFDRPAAQEHRDFDNKEDALKFSREKRKQFEKNGQGIERFRPESRRVNGKYRVTYTTIGSFQNNVILVATEPEYIKSADPITYDDNGNVIPLSQRFDETSKDTRFSISAELDEPYMAAVNSGNMDEAQRLVDEAAKMAGFDTPLLHHGTPSFGFTTFDLGRGENIIFATSNPLTAETYSGVTTRNRISDTSKIDVDNLHGNDLLNEIRKYRDRYNDFRLITDNEKEEIINESREDLALLASDAESFIEDNRDAFNDEKREIANRIVSSIKAMSKAFRDDEAWNYYRDFSDAVWDLKWMDESIQMELSDIIPEHRINMFLRKLVDFMYTGEMFVDDTFGFEYRFDNQLALELEADMNKGIYGLYGKGDNQLVIDANGSNWNQITPPEELNLYGPQRTRDIAEAARKAGYDSVLFKDLKDNGGETAYNGTSDVYMFFNPNQVKSADPVTYAEDGSVIPLSERFDPTNNDIRYSLPTQDSDGNILTDGQMEYFKNSQARDRDGKLAVVYHTTNAGGFTVFDPEYSDDKRSLFFTSNFDMSQSYGTNAFRNLMREGTENISFDDFIKMDGPSISTVVATRLIDLLDPETGEVLWDGTENPVGTGSTLKYWYKKDNSKYLVSVGGEVMDREGFDRWMNEQAEDILYGYKNHGYYECYLNLEDPLIIECNGSNWDSIKEPDFESLFLSYDGEDFYIDGTTVPFSLEDIRDLYGVGFAERAEEWIETADPTDLEMGDTLYTWHGGPYDPEVEGHWPTEEDTRYWCNEAEALGYDGVIFRDLKDNGPYGKFKETGDVYVAFSSNQVKDTRNENPTENPDIRYSITPEDEAKSQIAYDDAMDNSYELLAYYEQQLNVVNPETFDVTKAFREEDVVRFLDALKAEDSVPSDDPKFEEDRVRMAKSKEEFFNSVNARWNDRWITEGEVLKISSVKRAITNLVKGAMANSNSDAQYRNEVVKKTLVDARLAYQLMKQDRTELASYLLYHSAQRMMDGLEFIRDDTAFKEYQGIRDFLRTYRINAPEEFWENEPFLDFRKEYYGRLRIGKGNSNIEDVYGDLQDRWPHLFNEAEREKADLKSKPWDLLQHIGVVVDSNVTPFMEAYSSEEAASLATDLADQLYEIIANGGREVSLADSYKERFDAKTKAMKARHTEAILRERKIREEGIKKERIKFREYKEAQKEKTLHTKYFTNIKSKYDELTKRLLTNTKEKHIPEQYKRELAELLKAFDFQTVGSKKREARTGYKAQNTIKLEAMRTALERIEANSQLFHINDSITEIMKDLLGLNEASMNKQSIEGKTLDELNAAELKQIDKLLGFLIHEFNNYEKVKVGVKKAQAADIGHAQNDISLEHADAIGEGKDYQTPFLQSIDRIVNLDMMTPAFLFRKIDPNNEGLGLMWKEIRRSFDKYVRNTNQLNEWIEDIVGEYHDKGILWNKYGSGELSKWRSTNYAQKFDLTYGTLELTPAQMMSVACLANRKQAYDHMIGAGVVVAPVSFQAKIMSDVKKKINKSLSQKLTDADIKTIVAALTPEQRQVANKLQELMATKMAAWGNEASINVLGIKLFEDPDYFPIRSDKKGLTKDLDPNQFEQAIRNFGFTKAVQPGARNAIMIDDIFDVVTEHCNNMNLYNSYTEAMNDFMKVYNYKEVREDGEYTVEQALSHAFSEKVPMFIMQFIRDLNGNVSGRPSGIESLYNALLANAKKASVFANFRVAAQQPTAISRAFYVIDEKYIKGIKVDKDTMTEMFEHCPIALWKSWGYYDINMGKSIEDVIMNNGRWLEDKATDLYGKLDNVTWTAIWQMVKAETKDLHPELKEGSDEFFEHCNERMSEIVDLTQVVDSPMHRSHAMRDKGFFKKMTTAFMAEPTLTFNMLRDGVTRTSEAYKRGKKKLASQILSRTIGVYLLQSVMVAGAQSLVDALRGKKPDKDDDDDRFLHLWWVNFVEDWKDEFNPLGKIYVVKDIKSMMDGWESRNLALQGVYYLSLGYRQLTGDPYARSSKSWYENMLYGLGYLTGVPAKTMLTGTSNAKRMLGVETPILDDYLEFLDSFAKAKQDDESDGNIFGNSIGELLRQSMDAAAEMMGYKPIEDKGELQLAKKKPKEGLLARMGIGRTEEEKEQDAFDKKTQDIADKYADLSGEERDKKVWSSVTTYLKEQNEDKGVADMVTNGDYATINKYRQMYIAAGGGAEYFDERVLAESKKALKKSIKYDQTDAEITAQENIEDYMLNHGMTEEELSDIVYHSETARDLKVAFRLNDKDLMMESLEPLVNAGLTYSDLQRLWDNRNKMQLSSYKGRYKDKLKSTGKFIWPTDGVITSHFGYRNAPTAGASSNHPAIDIGAPQGTAVVAADGGIVISAGANGGYGNSVGIKHDNGMITWYNHLYSWNVKEGDTVAQGQQIAQVGSTGISTGPHLDFKIMNTDGEPVDPEKYLAAR